MYILLRTCMCIYVYTCVMYVYVRIYAYAYTYATACVDVYRRSLHIRFVPSSYLSIHLSIYLSIYRSIYYRSIYYRSIYLSCASRPRSRFLSGTRTAHDRRKDEPSVHVRIDTHTHVHSFIHVHLSLSLSFFLSLHSATYTHTRTESHRRRLPSFVRSRDRESDLKDPHRGVSLREVENRENVRRAFVLRAGEEARLCVRACVYIVYPRVSSYGPFLRVISFSRKDEKGERS